MDKVKFSVFAYRTLIGEKLKVLAEIDALYNEQNKHIYEKLVEVGALESDLSKPVGIIETPANGTEYNEKEIEINKGVLTKFAEVCNSLGFVNTTLIELEQFESLLSITATDIAKCIEP